MTDTSVELTLANGRVLRVVTDHDPPPVPFRDHDWTAVDDATYDGPGCPIGWGATEEAAIADLIEQLEAADSEKVQEGIARAEGRSDG